MRRGLFFILAVCGLVSCSSDAPVGPSPQTPFTFFVTSTTSTTGNLGGIQAADAMCQRLATAVGHGRRVWRAYLSVESRLRQWQPGERCSQPIGQGPWFNINGDRVAANLTELHDPTSAPRRRERVSGRERAENQRTVDGIADTKPARHPHGIERRWHADSRWNLCRLDVELGHVAGDGRSLRWLWSATEHGRYALVVEQRARDEQQLCEHRSREVAPAASTASRASRAARNPNEDQKIRRPGEFLVS